MSTLDAAITPLNANLDDGVPCPVCRGYARRYRRKFNASMARSLCWLVRVSGSKRQWVDVPNVAPSWLVRTNQLPTVRWWDLIERRPNDDDPRVKHSGFWRPTQDGINVVLNNYTIPSTVVTYKGDVQGYEGERITIRNALGVRFNYAEIMGTGGE